MYPLLKNGASVTGTTCILHAGVTGIVNLEQDHSLENIPGIEKVFFLSFYISRGLRKKNPFNKLKGFFLNGKRVIIFYCLFFLQRSYRQLLLLRQRSELF